CVFKNQTKRRKPTKPTPSISRAMIAMPYWLSVGMPSKNTVLVMVQESVPPALTVRRGAPLEPQLLSISIELSNTFSFTQQFDSGNAGRKVKLKFPVKGPVALTWSINTE